MFLVLSSSPAARPQRTSDASAGARFQQRAEEQEEADGLQDLRVREARVDPDRRAHAEQERGPGRRPAPVTEAQEQAEEQRRHGSADDHRAEPGGDRHELAAAPGGQRVQRRLERRARDVDQDRQQRGDRIEPSVGAGGRVHRPGEVDGERPVAHQVLRRLPHRDGVVRGRAAAARQQVEAKERHEDVRGPQRPVARSIGSPIGSPVGSPVGNSVGSPVARRREAKPQGRSITPPHSSELDRDLRCGPSLITPTITA